ncbi:hypothetical protein NE237_025325 [Protea cynaroides]|uniref:COG4 transport protein middle alpha-helical bundle domain-containing protein n=1 Tax=Protea cynaroides TaxID=273540 RepID=A0A9Q0H2X7_9MAGN|nr:hypothetical protein NE237_025325 [Protea cynaroides]
MVSKIRGLSSVDPDLGPRATIAFRSGSFSKLIQYLTGFYVLLEEFFMVENVRKAIKIDEHVPNSLNFDGTEITTALNNMSVSTEYVQRLMSNVSRHPRLCTLDLTATQAILVSSLIFLGRFISASLISYGRSRVSSGGGAGRGSHSQSRRRFLFFSFGFCSGFDGLLNWGDDEEEELLL